MSGSVSYPPAPAEGRTGLPRALRVSALLLVLANLVPVIGVVVGVITLGDVFVVYWAENLVIGIYTLARIVTARGAGSDAAARATLPLPTGALALVLGLFFCFHFGIFTLVHGVFTFTLVGMVTGLGEVSPAAVVLTVVALAVSHGYSLVVHWFARGERDLSTPQQAMGAPYPRVFVLHLSIIGSFFLLAGTRSEAFLGDPVPGAASLSDQLAPVLLLTLLKLALDVAFHLRAHRQAAGTAQGPSGLS